MRCWLLALASFIVQCAVHALIVRSRACFDRDVHAVHAYAVGFFVSLCVALGIGLLYVVLC